MFNKQQQKTRLNITRSLFFRLKKSGAHKEAQEEVYLYGRCFFSYFWYFLNVRSIHSFAISFYGLKRFSTIDTNDNNIMDSHNHSSNNDM